MTWGRYLPSGRRRSASRRPQATRFLVVAVGKETVVTVPWLLLAILLLITGLVVLWATPPPHAPGRRRRRNGPGR